jgi:DNA mismatch endonuclease (patch repair protein)
MTDKFPKEVRSRIMSSIKGKNTKPELTVRKKLFSHGLRYRIHVKNLPGSPDIVLPKYKTVIFVHGCFWHGHKGCKNFVLPKNRSQFWKDKIEGTRKRDSGNKKNLQILGWKVILIYECQLQKTNFEKLIIKIKSPN